jgi:hypothetical protein
MDFADIIKKLVDQNVRTALHYGEVTAITNSSGTYYLSVKLSGADTAITNVRYLRSYVPRIGDTVLVQVNKNDIFVVNSLASADKSLNPVAYRTSSYTVTKDTNTYIPFEAVANDDWDMWDVGSATVLTCKVPGRYQATGSILFTGQNSAYAAIFIEKGTQEIARQDGSTTTKDHGFHLSVTSVPFTMAIGNTIRLGVHHDHNPSNNLILSSGGVDHTGYFNALSVVYLGP